MTADELDSLLEDVSAGKLVREILMRHEASTVVLAAAQRYVRVVHHQTGDVGAWWAVDHAEHQQHRNYLRIERTDLGRDHLAGAR